MYKISFSIKMSDVTLREMKVWLTEKAGIQFYIPKVIERSAFLELFEKSTEIWCIRSSVIGYDFYIKDKEKAMIFKLIWS